MPSKKPKSPKKPKKGPKTGYVYADELITDPKQLEGAGYGNIYEVHVIRTIRLVTAVEEVK